MQLNSSIYISVLAIYKSIYKVLMGNTVINDQRDSIQNCKKNALEAKKAYFASSSTEPKFIFNKKFRLVGV
jgi:hypothetical protein